MSVAGAGCGGTPRRSGNASRATARRCCRYRRSRRGAVQDAVRLGAIGFDAVKHLVRCRLDHRPPHLDLARYPHLPVARVTTTAAANYLALLGAE